MTAPRQLYLPLSFKGSKPTKLQGMPLAPRREQDARWAELDARRPHETNLTAREREEFERLDAARYHRLLRKGQA